MALKYDPDEFRRSEEKEQPKRRQAAPDETDFALGQAKLDAMKNKEAREFLGAYGSDVDNIVKNLRENINNNNTNIRIYNKPNSINNTNNIRINNNIRPNYNNSKPIINNNSKPSYNTRINNNNSTRSSNTNISRGNSRGNN